MIPPTFDTATLYARQDFLAMMVEMGFREAQIAAALDKEVSEPRPLFRVLAYDGEELVTIAMLKPREHTKGYWAVCRVYRISVARDVMGPEPVSYRTLGLHKKLPDWRSSGESSQVDEEYAPGPGRRS